MKRIVQIAIIALAAFFATSGLASAQSLAEFARRERDRRNGTPEATVINNESLARRLPEPTTGAALQQQLAKPPDNATSIEKKDDKKDDKKDVKKDDKADAPKVRDEAWWRATFTEARENVSRAEAQAKLLERQLSEAKRDLLIRDDVFNKEGQLVPRINGLTADLEAAQRRADEARQKVTALEDELRRSGGMPGWAR